ncbi:MAG: hypothetical protein ACETWG_10755, partial [Candidatus Neomarinimicrobiota bacterium]
MIPFLVGTAGFSHQGSIRENPRLLDRKKETQRPLFALSERRDFPTRDPSGRTRDSLIEKRRLNVSFLPCRNGGIFP